MDGLTAALKGTVVTGLSSAARLYWVLEDSRGPANTASGAVPVLVTLTGTVTGFPAGSVVLAESGSPVAETFGAFSSIVTVNGSDRATPDTVGAKAMIRVQVPAAGETTWRLAPRVLRASKPAGVVISSLLAENASACPAGSTNQASNVLLGLSASVT